MPDNIIMNVIVKQMEREFKCSCIDIIKYITVLMAVLNSYQHLQCIFPLKTFLYVCHFIQYRQPLNQDANRGYLSKKH